jgi:archaellum component FlaC
MSDNSLPIDDEIEELERELARLDQKLGLDILTPLERQERTLQELESEYEKVQSCFNALVSNGLEPDMIQIGSYFFEWFNKELTQLKELQQNKQFFNIIYMAELITELYRFWEFLEPLKERMRSALFYM